MTRQQVSGAQKRKQAEEKKQKIEAVAQKLPKTDVIFFYKTQSPHCCTRKRRPAILNRLNSLQQTTQSLLLRQMNQLQNDY